MGAWKSCRMTKWNRPISALVPPPWHVQSAAYLSHSDSSLIQSERWSSGKYRTLRNNKHPQRAFASHVNSVQHESNKPRAVFPEKQRQFLRGLGHLSEQDPRGRPPEPAVQHERLLLQAEGAGAEHTPEQERQQDGNPAARYRLHPGPADRAGLECGAHPDPDPPDHTQHRHQHLVITVPGVAIRADDR